MTVDRGFFDLRIAGLYLPSLILLIIDPAVPWLSEWKPGTPWIQLIAFFSLLSAVFLHGLSRNVFGVGGPEENPMKRSETIRGIAVAISGKGPHENHPATAVGMIVNFAMNPDLLGKKKLIVFLIGGVSFGVWTFAVPFTIYAGISEFESLSTTAQLLLFAEFVWILQWRVWRYYTPSYLMDEDDFEGS